MVRHIAGVLVAVGQGRLQPSALERMLEIGGSMTAGEAGQGRRVGWGCAAEAKQAP